MAQPQGRRNSAASAAHRSFIVSEESGPLLVEHSIGGIVSTSAFPSVVLWRMNQHNGERLLKPHRIASAQWCLDQLPLALVKPLVGGGNSGTPEAFPCAEAFLRHAFVN